MSIPSLLNRVLARPGLLAVTNPTPACRPHFPELARLPGLPADVAPGTIKLIALGGAGGQTLHRMLDWGLPGIDCLTLDEACHTSLRTVRHVDRFVAGCHQPVSPEPEQGVHLVAERKERIRACLEGGDYLFIVAGLGGSIGTGAIPAIARLAREEGLLPVVLAIRPFTFEARRTEAAHRLLARLAGEHLACIAIDNNQLLGYLGPTITLAEAFRSTAMVQTHLVDALGNLLTRPLEAGISQYGVRRFLGRGRITSVGFACSRGRQRAADATRQALRHPFLAATAPERAGQVLAIACTAEPATARELVEVRRSLHSGLASGQPIGVANLVRPQLGATLRVTLLRN